MEMYPKILLQEMHDACELRVKSGKQTAVVNFPVVYYLHSLGVAGACFDRAFIFSERGANGVFFRNARLFITRL